LVDDPISTLSEGQKNCLRLVGQGMSSKEIAKATGLTPQTVDTYVKAGMARLGVANRRDAARALAAFELSQQSGSPPPALARRPAPADAHPHTGGTGWRQWLRLPPVGGGYSDLTWTQKSYQALLVAVVAAAVVIALALALAGLLQTFS
jgi:DNA-binding CsgD family transcriptional regulator